MSENEVTGPGGISPFFRFESFDDSVEPPLAVAEVLDASLRHWALSSSLRSKKVIRTYTRGIILRFSSRFVRLDD
jgi:hypothetical protein